MADLAEKSVTHRRKLVLEKQSIAALRKMGKNAHSAQMAEKQLPGRTGAPINKILTNVYGLNTSRGSQKQLYRYDIAIEGIPISGGTKVNFSQGSGHDRIKILKRDRCRDVFLLFQQDDLLKGRSGVYDLQSILYVDKPLEIEEPKVIHFKCEQLLQERFKNFKYCSVTVKKVEGSRFCITIGDIADEIVDDLDSVDHTLAQFLDILTSQHAIFDRDNHLSFSASLNYLLHPEKYGYSPEEELPILPENLSYVVAGSHKSTRYVEGPKGRDHATPTLAVDVKKTAFHQAGVTCLDKVQCYVSNICNLEESNQLIGLEEHKKLNEVMRGLYFETNYGDTTLEYRIDAITEENAITAMIDFEDGSKLSVKDFFHNRKQIKLKYPRLPLIISGREMEKRKYFPLELCFICENQRVRLDQHVLKSQEKLIKHSAVRPTNRRKEIENNITALGLRRNAQMDSAGVSFVPDPLTVSSGRLLPAPTIAFKENVKVERFNTWSGKKYLIPRELKSWAFLAFLKGGHALTPEHAERFITAYRDAAQRNGMEVSHPEVIEIFTVHNSYNRVYEEIEKLQGNCQFMLIIQSTGDVKCHAAIKNAERQFGITSQAIEIDTLNGIVKGGKAATLNNILHKTNIKLGGINYSLSVGDPISQRVLGESTLYIGIGASHAMGGNLPNRFGSSDGNGGKSTSFDGTVANGYSSNSGNGISGSPNEHIHGIPSVVGYAANIGKSHAFEFIGDFLFHEQCRDEKPELIGKIVERCVMEYRENRQADVKRIILYRNGCAEGQFPQILKYEVAFMKAALERIKCDAKITIIVPNKMHNIRFFEEDSSEGIKNVQPGTVIDTNVVHPTFCEFYLNSHRALQGTAKTPRFTVLLNEIGLKLDSLETITHYLCFGHQIVYSPTSLPTPAYVANCYADRGRMVYTEYMTRSNNEEELSYAELEERLSYFSHRTFRNIRINA